MPDDPGREILAYPLREACEMLGFSVTTFYAAAESERPRSYKYRSRRFVTRDAIREWLAKQEGVSNDNG